MHGVGVIHKQFKIFLYIPRLKFSFLFAQNVAPWDKSTSSSQIYWNKDDAHIITATTTQFQVDLAVYLNIPVDSVHWS